MTSKINNSSEANAWIRFSVIYAGMRTPHGVPWYTTQQVATMADKLLVEFKKRTPGE